MYVLKCVQIKIVNSNSTENWHFSLHICLSREKWEMNDESSNCVECLLGRNVCTRWAQCTLTHMDTLARGNGYRMRSTWCADSDLLARSGKYWFGRCRRCARCWFPSHRHTVGGATKWDGEFSSIRHNRRKWINVPTHAHNPINVILFSSFANCEAFPCVQSVTDIQSCSWIEWTSIHFSELWVNLSGAKRISVRVTKIISTKLN